MPIYEYLCEDCGSVFEVKQRFTDPPLGAHPECGGAVKRLISAPALQFKGSGWYITDYARSASANGKGNQAETKSESSTPAAKDAAPGSESKPATKS